MSTPDFTPRERQEIHSADTSRLFWLKMEGRVFWRNALEHARDEEQRRKVEHRLAEARKRGAASLVASNN